MMIRGRRTRSRKRYLRAIATAACLAAVVSGARWGCSRAGQDAGGDPGQEQEPVTCGIVIEASRPTAVTWPLTVVPVGENGERGLWREPEWADEEATGEATAEYGVYVPRNGSYVLWGYCLGDGESPMAADVRIDGQEPYVLNGEPLAEGWHWIRGRSRNLSEGMHTVTIVSRFEHLALRKLFLVDDDAHPQDYGVVDSELFHDDFNGCNEGNFSLWERHCGTWKLVSPESKVNRGEHVLAGSSRSQAVFCLSREDWASYALSVRCRTVSAAADSMAGICFGMNGTDDYYLLRWSAARPDARVVMQLIRREGLYAALIDSFEAAWAPLQWHDLRVELRPGCIEIAVDHGRKRRVPWDQPVAGGIGLWLAGTTEAEFDDVEVRPGSAGNLSCPTTETRPHGPSGRR